MRVTVKDLAKVYPDGTRALDSVDFEIAPGEGVVILGANGCGKSTLLRCLLGLETISAGQALLDGIDVTRARGIELRKLRRRIGSVFQQFNLIGNLSAFQNVLFGRLGHDGLLRSLSIASPPQVRDRAMACLERVGLPEKARHRVDQLSGGQQQRVAIARMLMQDPQIVFADEPVASLDPKAGRQVMDLLWEVVEEKGISVICVLHQLELARAYAQRIIGLKGGRIVLDAPPSAISAAAFEALYEGGNQKPAQDEHNENHNRTAA